MCRPFSVSFGCRNLIDSTHDIIFRRSCQHGEVLLKFALFNLRLLSLQSMLCKCSFFKERSQNTLELGPVHLIADPEIVPMEAVMSHSFKHLQQLSCCCHQLQQHPRSMSFMTLWSNAFLRRQPWISRQYKGFQCPFAGLSIDRA